MSPRTAVRTLFCSMFLLCVAAGMVAYAPISRLTPTAHAHTLPACGSGTSEADELGTVAVEALSTPEPSSMEEAGPPAPGPQIPPP